MKLTSSNFSLLFKEVPSRPSNLELGVVASGRCQDGACASSNQHINHVAMNSLFYVSIVWLLSSCATLKVERMAVKEDKYVYSSTNKKVNVRTSKTFKQKLFKVSDYNAALIQSIEHSKLFTIAPQHPDYQITAVLVHWFQPPFSLAFHTDLRVHYTIKDNNSVVFDREIESHSVARMADAVIGSKRGRISMERAVKQNIAEFLTQIAKLKL